MGGRGSISLASVYESVWHGCSYSARQLGPVQLPQLHQLRGRVGRGPNQSTCLLLYKEPLNISSKKRLSILRETEDGFKISEVDLNLRGSGDAIVTAQSGLPRFRLANIDMIEMLMETAHQQARYFLAKDPNLETVQGKAVKNLTFRSN